MVRWQNQGDSGLATPSSSDDDLEEVSPEELNKCDHSLPNT